MTNDDPDDLAESFDEDLLGTGGRVLSDEATFEYPPERLHGVPFVDADVTDESLEDRLAQEQADDLPLDPEEPDEIDEEPLPADDLPVELDDDYPFDDDEESADDIDDLLRSRLDAGRD